MRKYITRAVVGLSCLVLGIFASYGVRWLMPASPPTVIPAASQPCVQQTTASSMTGFNPLSRTHLVLHVVGSHGLGHYQMVPALYNEDNACLMYGRTQSIFESVTKVTVKRVITHKPPKRPSK